MHVIVAISPTCLLYLATCTYLPTYLSTFIYLSTYLYIPIYLPNTYSIATYLQFLRELPMHYEILYGKRMMVAEA